MYERPLKYRRLTIVQWLSICLHRRNAPRHKGPAYIYRQRHNMPQEKLFYVFACLSFLSRHPIQISLLILVRLMRLMSMIKFKDSRIILIFLTYGKREGEVPSGD